MQQTTLELSYYSNYNVPKAAYVNLINVGIQDVPFWDVNLTGIIPLKPTDTKYSYHREYSVVIPEMVVITLYDPSNCFIVSTIKVHRSNKWLQWEKPAVRQYIAPFKIQLTFEQNLQNPGMFREVYWRGINYNKDKPGGNCNCVKFG